jgi:hypothetical protein
MIIRATNGDKVNVFTDDRFLIKIDEMEARNSVLNISVPNRMKFGVHGSEDLAELNWLSDTITAALLAGHEYFDAEQELKKFRFNDETSIKNRNAEQIFRLAKEIRYSDCSEETIYELTDELIRLTGICPQCDGSGQVPQAQGMLIADCDQCGGKGFILPRPSLEEEFGEMPF